MFNRLYAKLPHQDELSRSSYEVPEIDDWDGGRFYVWLGEPHRKVLSVNHRQDEPDKLRIRSLALSDDDIIRDLTQYLERAEFSVGK